MQQLNITLSGATIAEIITGAQGLIETLSAVNTSTLTTKKTRKRAAAVVAVDEDDQIDILGDDEETVSDDADLSFDSVDEDEVEVAPKKNTKANGKTTLTAKDVNAACLAYARKHDRKKTLAVLAKFKVKSVSELTPDQYADAVKALKV